MIEISNMSFAYRRGKALFDKLSMQMNKGGIYGLLGRNGAGKSTLLKIINGLLFPSTGICSYNGLECKERQPEMLSRVFYIPEEFELPALRIEKFVELNAPFYQQFSHEQFRNYLTEFELDKTLNLKNLSMGQKKKFMIAFGLATNTETLILDEPTNGLDIPSKTQFRKIIASIMTDERIILISTHQVLDLARLIDHIIVLENGKILFSQNTADISDALAFKHVKKADDAEVIYSEPVLGGYSAVLRNSGEHTELDIELLFNAIIAEHGAIRKLFKPA